ncbi:MAG: DUF3800 domain-containing protein [Xanthomonadales bacterium]|nr:DUF3800 domain-containing protein [Xanthomonadales bacterium]
MARSLLIYCDESDQSGKRFSNFYGGLLVESEHLSEVEQRIRVVREAHRLNDEVKWQKISAAYADKYIALVDELFDLVAEGRVKIRIMFTQNINALPRLTAEQREDGFFKLYYQFIKWSFGLQSCGREGTTTHLRLFFDQLPDTKEKCQRFKGFLSGLGKSREFRQAGIKLGIDGISEVDSKKHELLQCVDVVLGAMQFRLNEKHLEKPEGSRVRGKRTRAKESVYKHINARIRLLRPGFNIGITTGDDGDSANRWRHPYRHWLFRPRVEDDS